ncbi:MAG: hypothetical protein HUU41_23570 [Bryobacteraceae bacterium]|nr:hypothetical protein [Bryobacterales bacterium]MCZ2073995.1 hypothetical protein [Bryobacterales bacterium]NUN04098.1 hypothetical protein [Bryobacteraceae bacterium]
MTESLSALESQRAQLLRALASLKDMRPGSVVGAVFRCGKPSCHCARAEDPGHGPNLRLTYKWRGKTVTEALPTPAAVQKAEREIAEFREYQRLGRELVEVNEKICRLRPVGEQPLREQEKGRPTRSSKKSHGSKHDIVNCVRKQC